MKSWLTDTGRVRYLSQPYTIEDKPLPWQIAGRQQTASGYGRKLTSSRVVRLPDGRTRRVYVTCFSNSGTAWVELDGMLHVVDLNGARQPWRGQ